MTDNPTTIAEDAALRIGVALWIVAQVPLIPFAPRMRLERIRWWLWYARGYRAEKSGRAPFEKWWSEEPPGIPPRQAAWRQRTSQENQDG